MHIRGAQRAPGWKALCVHMKREGSFSRKRGHLGVDGGPVRRGKGLRTMSSDADLGQDAQRRELGLGEGPCR